MPRVLLVLDSLVPGGAERSTVALLPHLIDRGVVPEVAVLHDRPGLQDDVVTLGVALHRVEPGGGRRRWIGGLRALIDARAPDLVHTSLFEADLCGRIAAATRRVPAVSSLATEAYGSDHLGSPQFSRVKVRASQLADLATARSARRLHAVSAHVADAMARHLRYPRERIDVVYRGRPDHALPPSFDRAASRRELGLTAGQSAVLVVARHERVKGIDRVVDAFPSVIGAVPGAALLIAGREGEHTAELERQVADLALDDDVRFLGHRGDIASLLAASDAFVLPSRREGLPGSLIEAMAATTPAVVADLPQVREVATEQHARLVDAGKRVDLAAALVETLVDTAAARARATLARQRFLDRFTIERSADGMAAFYDRALA